MTGVEAQRTSSPAAFTDAELRWVREHLPELRRSAREKRFLRWTLATGFVAGLVAHAGGYLLRSLAPAEPLALMVELLYALGWALWTGVIVAVMVQIIPEWKQRQFDRYLDVYEAALTERPRAHRDLDPESGDRT